MNEKDSKILIKLFENSRQSIRQISKDIRLSKERVSARITEMENNNIIKGYSLKIDYEKLKLFEFVIFIRLKNLSKKTTDSMINFLEKNEYTTWIGKAFGKYDFKISILVSDLSQINIFIEEIMEKFGGSIDTMDSMLVTEKYKAPAKNFLENLLDKKIEKIENIKNEGYQNFELDNIDKKILYHLGQNSKEKLVNISQKINLTPEGVKGRIRRLEKNGIIKGYSIVVNGNKFGKIWCLALLNIEKRDIENFRKSLKKVKAISSYNQTIGIWNFNITFFANDLEELYQVINKIRNEFSKEIKGFEFMIFFEFYKYPKVPSIMLS